MGADSCGFILSSELALNSDKGFNQALSVMLLIVLFVNAQDFYIIKIVIYQNFLRHLRETK
ncbi:MAG: hypothetical protein ACJA2G_001359 [Cognaticolwellia sp.]|jgi:hypothetical protein